MTLSSQSAHNPEPLENKNTEYDFLFKTYVYVEIVLETCFRINMLFSEVSWVRWI